MRSAATIRIALMVLSIFLMVATPTNAAGRRRIVCGICPPTVICNGSCCQAELSKCRLRLSDLEQQAKVLENSLIACTERKACLEGELEKVEQERDALAGEVTRLRGELGTCQKELERVKKQLSSLKAQVKTLRERMAAQEKRIAHLVKTLNETKDELDTTESELEKTREELADTTDELKACESQHNGVKQALAAAEAKLTACEEAKHRLDVELARTNTWIWFLGLVSLVLLMCLLVALLCCVKKSGQHDRDLDHIRELDSLYQGTKSRADELKLRVSDLESGRHLLETQITLLRSEKSNVESFLAAANERAYQTADKKNCCCKCGSTPAVVYGPTHQTSPTGPVTTVPNGPVTTTTPGAPTIADSNGQPGNGQHGNGQHGNGQPGNGQPGNGQQNKPGMGATLGTVAGAAIGTYYGGPVGGVVGATAGGAIGAIFD